MKKFFKIGCGGLLALIILGAIIGALGGEDTSNNDDNTETEQQETSEPATEEKTEEKAEEKTKETVGIGTPLEVGDAIFTLNGVELADQVGPSVLPTKASGKYIVLNVTYRNNGNEAVTIDSSFFKLKRGDKTYEADSAASMSANQGENGAIQNSFFLQEVNPDMEISGRVVFDVAPEVAEATDLQLQVQTGFWGTETGIINLQ